MKKLLYTTASVITLASVLAGVSTQANAASLTGEGLITIQRPAITLEEQQKLNFGILTFAPGQVGHYEVLPTGLTGSKTANVTQVGSGATAQDSGEIKVESGAGTVQVSFTDTTTAPGLSLSGIKGKIGATTVTNAGAFTVDGNETLFVGATLNFTEAATVGAQSVAYNINVDYQ